jgi:hypothetical protein
MVTEKELKRSAKTEALSMRMDPKTRFMVEIVARIRGQSISTVVERALQEAADNTSTPEGHNWRYYWHVQDGIRSLRMWSDPHLFPTFDDEYRLEFTRRHWQFFYQSSECKSYRSGYIEILWPKIDEFLSLWSKTKSSDYFAAGNAMEQALLEASVQPPDWPGKPKKDAKKPPANESATHGSGGPSWDAPKGGDLDDEIPF